MKIPNDSLDVAQHKNMLGFIDLIFGSYNVVMIAASTYAWWTGRSSLWPTAGLTIFLLVNLFFSKVSKTLLNPFKIEITRSVVGPFLAATAFITTQEIFGGWWTGFLIMCLGGNILHTLNTQKPDLGRKMVIIYTCTLTGCMIAIHYSSDWYMMLVNVGAIAIAGLVFSEILVQLSASLFNERSIKLTIQEQKAQVEEQRAIIEKKSMELEQTYLHITDSIRYAKRIQTALTPLEEKIKQDLPNLFFFNRPKEILSGDFYWFGKVEQYIFLAIGDCTGHGVPGAIMTVIGNNLLTSIIVEGRNIQPMDILTEMDERLTQTIQRHEIDEQEFSDGMDLSLIRIDKQNNELIFAGAKRNMVIITKESSLIELKGNKYPIGRSLDHEKSFDETTTTLKPGDTLYLYTDGYADQFGGNENKKYLTQRFRQLLLEIHHKEMYEQHFLLDRKLKLWRGNNSQTDDILIAGIRIN
jgi:serine phosphatase RsbU (regulator of sigma subunit)